MQDTLAEKTYRRLRRKVLCGELQPGDQLVNRALAAEMGVSPAPLREAIRRLASEGIVRHVPGAGAFVPKLTRRELEELYILREAVESCAAAEAARYVSEAQLEELDALCCDFVALAEQIGREKGQVASDEIFDRWMDLEERFHSTLIEAANNRTLTKVIVDHRTLTRIFTAQHQHGLGGRFTRAVAERTCREHAALAAALRQRDADSMRRLMSEHIRQGCQIVMEFLRSRQQEQK